MKRLAVILILLGAISATAGAQQWSLSTNALDYANFGTLNLEGSVAVSRHFNINVGLKYNPWIFGNKSVPELQKYNKQRNVWVGARYYPWFVSDGWFIGVMAGWREYATAGIFSQKAEEGDAFGGGIGFGYSLILHKNLNLDFGVYGWGGLRIYNTYSCAYCGRPIESGSKPFVFPTNVQVGITWVFGNRRNDDYREDRYQSRYSYRRR